MAKKIKDLTAQPSTPLDSDFVAWGQATGSGFAYKMTFTQLKAKLDSMSGGDVTAPTVLSMTVADANPDRIVVVFSESVTATTAGWSAEKDAVAWTISSVSGSGTTWTFVMASAAGSGDVLTMSYNSGTGNTIDASGNELASFTDSAVTNNVGSGYETETDAFLAANTGLSGTIQDAVNDLVVALKGIGWSKFHAVYPLVGGTAAAHKWNLIDPADTDAAFRLTFTGSLTHDANGITPGGTTSDYADTKFVPDTHFPTANSASIGYYIRSISGDQQLMGAYVDGSFFDTYQLSTYGGLFYGQIGMVTDTVSTPSPFTRLVVGSRTGATTTDFYRDGTNFKSSTLAYDDTCTVSIYLFGRNANGTNNSAGNVPCSFAFIADGLTSGEVSTLNTAVNAFQTAIGRNV